MGEREGALDDGREARLRLLLLLATLLRLLFSSLSLLLAVGVAGVLFSSSPAVCSRPTVSFIVVISFFFFFFSSFFFFSVDSLYDDEIVGAVSWLHAVAEEVGEVLCGLGVFV